MMLLLALLLRIMPDQHPRQRCDNSYKIGCSFYMIFIILHDNSFRYRCNEIHSEHIYERNSSTWNRIPYYRFPENPQLRFDAILFMNNDLRFDQAMIVLNTRYDNRIQSKDIYCIIQMNKEKIRSLNDVNISIFEIQ